MQGIACQASLCPMGMPQRLQRCSHVQQAQALVDVVWSQQPKLVQANEVHCKDAPQLHAPQNVVPIVECKCLACCRYLPLYISLFSPYMILKDVQRTLSGLSSEVFNMKLFTPKASGRTCQSAWMGLVRRWQFQLNMKTLSADVMSALGASFLLHRSCKIR